MHLAFAFLARAAERSQDGTVHVFGAGFDTVQLTQTPASTTPLALVVKFRCEQGEEGHVHEVGVDLSDPHGRRAHLASERLVIGQGAASKNHPLGAMLVVAVDAPLRAEGEHVFHLSLDQVLITAMPITVLRDDARNELPHAAQIRAKWMFELGMSEEEIKPLCDPENYPATTDEEAANLSALRRMRSSNWSV